MCGIGGFSLNKNSKINARTLAHALLSQIEVRGRMSSGVAFPNVEGGISVYKDAVAGSNLPLRVMPRNTKTAILHTRYATKGSPQINANNHPVWSPNKSIALVHNGVIWNDYSLRSGILVDADMPEVDTAVIPALLEEHGTRGVQHLAGDAAVAWLDVNQWGTMHLARIESSPVAYTNLEDGSFVFASMPSLLRGALDALDLKYGQVFTMTELDYYQIKHGVIWSLEDLPEPRGFRTGVAASTRNATSGGHGTGSPTTRIPKPGQTGSTFVGPIGAERLESEVDREVDEAVAAEEEAVRAWDMANDMSPMFKDGFDEFMPNNKSGDRFFTVDSDGEMQTYADLDELETRLLYLAGNTGDDGLGEGKTKWVNHFLDIGSFDIDGTSMISWVEEPSEIRMHENPNDDGLGYVRDGVGILSMLAGR